MKERLYGEGARGGAPPSRSIPASSSGAAALGPPRRRLRPPLSRRSVGGALGMRSPAGTDSSSLDRMKLLILLMFCSICSRRCAAFFPLHDAMVCNFSNSDARFAFARAIPSMSLENSMSLSVAPLISLRTSSYWRPMISFSSSFPPSLPRIARALLFASASANLLNAADPELDTLRFFSALLCVD